MKCKGSHSPAGGTGNRIHVFGLRTEGLTAKLKKKKTGKIQSIQWFRVLETGINIILNFLFQKFCIFKQKKTIFILKFSVNKHSGLILPMV